MISEACMIHPTATVEEAVQVGEGTRIWRYAHVRTGAIIGANCNIGGNVYIDKHVKIGDHCKIQNNSLLYEGCHLGTGVFIGPNTVTTNDLRPRATTQAGEWTLTHTFFDDGCSIGAGSVIVCGVYVGKHSMVAAGSVVTRDVSPFTLVKGNPARACAVVCHCGRICRPIASRRFSYRCLACQKIITFSEDVKVRNLEGLA